MIKYGVDKDDEMGVKLMSLIQSNDSHAFTLLADGWWDKVYNVCVKMLKSRQDAEEATQDTFLKILGAKDSFDSVRRFTPWMLSIAGNTCRDTIRRRQSRAKYEQPHDFSDDLIVDTQAIINDRELVMRMAVNVELSKLSDKLHRVVAVYYMEGRSNEETAAKLGVAVNTVKRWKREAKKILASRLRSWKDNNDYA